MGLTVGYGPFGVPGGGRFNFEVSAPGKHVLYLEDSPRRVRVMFGGETVADSRSVKLLHETKHLPIYYFPEREVRMETCWRRANTLPTVRSRAMPRTGR